MPTGKKSCVAVTPVLFTPSPKSQAYETILRLVPGVELAALKLTVCNTSGVSGENTNFATVSRGMVVVVLVDVVVVLVDVVVSVTFTMPGPTGFLLWQPISRAANRGGASNSLRMT